jgi:methionine salvage enolase-phosphatase E1
MENASKKYSVDVVKKMIKEQQDKYSWEFVFLGSNIDAVSTAEDMGIREGNAMTYANSPSGTREAFQSVSENLSFCRRNERSDMSFKEKDYKAQKKAGV